jgi:hypothetical protein
MGRFQSRKLIVSKGKRKAHVTLLAKEYKDLKKPRSLKGSTSIAKREALLEELLANIYPLILHMLKARGFPYELHRECKSEIICKVLEGLETYNPKDHPGIPFVGYIATRFLEGMDMAVRQCGSVVTVPKSVRSNWVNQLQDLLGDMEPSDAVNPLPRKNYHNRLREYRSREGLKPIEFPSVDFKNHISSVITPDTYWDYHSPEQSGYPAATGNELTIRQIEGPSEDISTDEGLDYIDSRCGEEQANTRIDLQSMRRELNSDRFTPWERRALIDTLGLFGRKKKTLDEVSKEHQLENGGRGSKEWIWQLRKRAEAKLTKRLMDPIRPFAINQSINGEIS